MPRPAALLAALLTAAAPAAADVFHVAPAGDDAADGGSPGTAWATVGHALDAVPAGDPAAPHVVRLAPGDYPLAGTAVLKSGVTLIGSKWPWDANDRDRARFSVLRPGPGWKKAAAVGDNDPSQYLLRIEKGARGVTVRDVRFRGDRTDGGEVVATGGFHADQPKGLTLEGLDLAEFRTCGLRLLYAKGARVSGCRLHDTALEKAGRHWGGQVWVAWPKDATFEDCRLTCDAMGGYGFKGSGADGCRITRCATAGHYFSVEFPHENLFGLEIDHCRLGGCISVPKGGPQGDPAERGHARSVYIHHNHLSDSYTVEGPRQYLEFAYNLVAIDRPNGRCYTQHGGEVPGPVSIHHNIFVNVDRSLVWMNRGYAGGIDFFNNTAFAADAGDRSGFLFDSYTADRLDDWRIKNNLIVAAWPRPRRLLPDRNGVPAKIELEANLFHNLTDVPPGGNDLGPVRNLTGLIERTGDRPAPFFRPVADSPLIDAGVDVGLPFAGDAPDVGAVEFVPPGSDYRRPVGGLVRAEGLNRVCGAGVPPALDSRRTVQSGRPDHNGGGCGGGPHAVSCVHRPRPLIRQARPDGRHAHAARRIPHRRPRRRGDMGMGAADRNPHRPRVDPRAGLSGGQGPQRRPAGAGQDAGDACRPGGETQRREARPGRRLEAAVRTGLRGVRAEPDSRTDRRRAGGEFGAELRRGDHQRGGLPEAHAAGGGLTSCPPKP